MAITNIATLDKYFDDAVKTAPAKLYYSADGVHPNQNGAQFIAKIYAQTIEQFLK